MNPLASVMVACRQCISDVIFLLDDVFCFWEDCGRTLLEASATFHSPNYPNSLTTSGNNVEDCEWRIKATHGEKIFLNITDLDIAQSDNCRDNYLEVRDGYWHKAPLKGLYTHPLISFAPIIAYLSALDSIVKIVYIDTA